MCCCYTHAATTPTTTPSVANVDTTSQQPGENSTYFAQHNNVKLTQHAVIHVFNNIIIATCKVPCLIYVYTLGYKAII